MGFLSAIPLFGFFLLGYDVLVFAGVFPMWLNQPLFVLNLPSGVDWHADGSAFVLIMATVVLYIELFKSTRTSEVTVLEHLFSTFVLIGFVVQFFIFPAAANTTFLLLTLMAMIDVIAGFTITISTARRDFAMK